MKTARPFVLAGCEVQPDRNRLLRAGETIVLEPKIMATLVLLAEAGGAVVTREQLLERVWDGAWVGDEVVTRAIGELRRAFGDDPRSPRVIETIRKRGYRLLAAVSEPEFPGSVAGRAAEANGGGELAGDALESGGLPVPPPSRPRGQLVAAAGALALLVVAVAAVSLRIVPTDQEAEPGAAPDRSDVRVYPLSGSLEIERDPAVSPDGTRVAHAIVAADESLSRLAIRLLRGGRRQDLTDGSAADRYPTWSPDGTELAFQRHDADGCRLAIVAVTGGPVRSLVPCDPHAPPHLAWSPDGESLVLTRLVEGGPRRFALYRLDLASLELEQLTHPEPPFIGDSEPAFAPDGRSVVFGRALPGGASDLWRLDLGSRREHRLTFDHRSVEGQTFASDGQTVVFASDRGGSFALWSVSRNGGEPVWLTGTGSKIKHPSGARTAPVLAFEDWHFQIALWRIPLDGPGDDARDRSRAGEIVARSSGWDFSPALSPDGAELAFVSSRSGSHELWVVAAAGGDPEQLATGGAQVLSVPRWSPDGELLLYAAFAGGQPDLWVVARRGAVPRRLTDTGTVELAPSWSNDGRFVYFTAEREGRWHVHRLPAAGGEEPQVVASGIAAREAPNGGLLVVEPERSGLWWVRSGVPEGDAFVPELHPRDWASWDVGADGVYYVVGTGEETELRFRPFEGPSRSLGRVGELARPGLAAARGGGAVYLSRVDRAEVDVMVAENLGST